jgi:hypothetical protein
VLFTAGKTCRTWTLLEGPGVDPWQVCRLFRDAAYESEHGAMLLKLWTLSLAACHRCKPPLVLAGSVGSGKTRLGVGIFELLGIPPRVSAIAENGEGDFWTSLDFGGLCCFDNADTRVQWLPDAMAAAATDGTHEKRLMYSDSDLIQQRARASAIITSSNATFASDAGLADRLIVVRLDRRIKDTAESALTVEIEANRDACMTWFARTHAKAGVSRASARDAGVNRRHPDFAGYAVRLGTAMGCEDAAVASLAAAETDKSRFAIENDFVGEMILKVMAAKAWWEGSCAELGEMLSKEVEGLDERAKHDLNARKLGRRIEKLWPHMEALFSGRKRVLHGKTLYSLKGVEVGEVEDNSLFPKSAHREMKVEGLMGNGTLNPPLPPSDLVDIPLDDYRAEF